MKYVLKPKRWSIFNFLYSYKYGTGDRLVILDGEKQVLDFFKIALEEDIAEKTSSMDNNSYYSGGTIAFEAVMEIASCSAPFRKLLKHNFKWFRDILETKLIDNKYRAYWIANTMKCNPRNYKIFAITEKEVRGSKFQVIERLTWYKFYKECLASGMTEQELVFNK